MTVEQKDHARQYKKDWRTKNRDIIVAQKRLYYNNNKEKLYTLERDRQYRKRYNITLEDYNYLFIKQNGLCAICESDKSGKNDRYFAVDHNHKTDEVRGLLCTNCNPKLGWYEKNSISVERYLESEQSYYEDFML